MISSQCFTAKWLQAKKRDLKAGDLGLLERAVHALALLGHLAESDLDFVFKGGTSLLLHVPVIRRLSIDIDILCLVTDAELHDILGEVAAMPPFLRYEKDERGERGLPRRSHFRFFYKPLVTGNPAPYVFLDIVEESHIPHEVIYKPIALPFLEIDREVRVKIPTVESLLADKLSAFAPRTIGVLFLSQKGLPTDTMQIVKQLFDVGELFSLAENLNAIRQTYKRIFDLENGYRGGHFTLADVLNDTLDASLRLCMHRLKGVTDHLAALSLEDGARRLASHLVNHRFNLGTAKVAAAKAGLLSRLILSEVANPSISSWRGKPDHIDLRLLSIEGDWERLNRLKPILPEAFYYWYQTSKIDV